MFIHSKFLKRFLTLCSKKIPVNLHQFCCLQAVVTFSDVHGVKNQTKMICDYILVKRLSIISELCYFSVFWTTGVMCLEYIYYIFMTLISSIFSTSMPKMCQNWLSYKCLFFIMIVVRNPNTYTYKYMNY